jgi:hypothetical protein
MQLVASINTYHDGKTISTYFLSEVHIFNWRHHHNNFWIGRMWLGKLKNFATDIYISKPHIKDRIAMISQSLEIK